MKFSFGKINTFFKKKGNGYWSRDLYHPGRDWKIILFVFSFVALCLVGFGAYLFIKINTGDIFKTSKGQFQTQSEFNSQHLKDVVNNFEAKKERLIDLEIHPVVASDPSL